MDAATRLPGDDEAFLSAVAGELDAVERMLARLDDGTWQDCEVCGGPVGREALRHAPLLTRCPAHAPGPDDTEGLERPVAVLAPGQPLPFAGEQPQA